MGVVFGAIDFWPNHFLCTGAAQTHISKSKLAFRARFGQSDARFYAQAQWFRTLCTGAVVSNNCVKPLRLCMKIARLQNRQKPLTICHFGVRIGALLARFGRFCSLSAPPAAEGQQRLLKPFSGVFSGTSRAPPGPLPDGSRTPLGRFSGTSRRRASAASSSSSGSSSQ